VCSGLALLFEGIATQDAANSARRARSGDEKLREPARLAPTKPSPA